MFHDIAHTLRLHATQWFWWTMERAMNVKENDQCWTRGEIPCACVYPNNPNRKRNRKDWGSEPVAVTGHLCFRLILTLSSFPSPSYISCVEKNRNIFKCIWYGPSFFLSSTQTDHTQISYNDKFGMNINEIFFFLHMLSKLRVSRINCNAYTRDTELFLNNSLDSSLNSNLTQKKNNTWQFIVEIFIQL